MKKVLAVLGLTAFTFQNNFWGKKEDAHVKLSQEQLEKIDAALENAGTGDSAQTIADLQEKVSGLEQSETAVKEALTAAMELNGIAATENQTPVEAISALGAKCKEYGESKHTHSLPKTDGKDKADSNGLIEGYIDPNAEHNQLLTKLSS